MDKKMKKEFTLWFIEKWEETGGLIPQGIAANIIGISDTGVKYASERGKLKAYEFEKIKLYALKDVLMYKTKRESKD